MDGPFHCQLRVCLSALRIFTFMLIIAATSHGPKTQDDSEEASKSKQGITGTAYPKQHQHLIEAAVSNVAINYSFHLP